MADERFNAFDARLTAMAENMARIAEQFGATNGDGPRRPRRHEQEEDDDVSSLKLTVPKFTGKTNPDDYIDWERAMEDFF